MGFCIYSGHCDTFTLDIVTHLNTLNSVLQGKNLYAYDMIKSLNRFQLKLQLFLRHLLMKKVDHFPTMKLLKIPENKFEEYGEIINALNDDFSQRFGDFRKFETSLAIIRDPFSIDIDMHRVSYNLRL